MTTTHRNMPESQKCHISGCNLGGGINAGHGWICRFHFGVAYKDAATVSTRINREAFQKLYKLAIRMTSGGLVEMVRQDQVEWLNTFTEFAPFFPPAWNPRPALCGEQIMKALEQHAQHGLGPVSKPKTKTDAGDWKTALQAVKSSINLPKGDYDE